MLRRGRRVRGRTTRRTAGPPPRARGGPSFRPGGRRWPGPGECGAPPRNRWPEFDARVNRLANALSGAGVGAGDRVLWLGQNCHRVLEGMLAAAKLGAVFSPANWRQTGAEFAFVVDDARPAVVIWQEEEIG